MHRKDGGNRLSDGRFVRWPGVWPAAPPGLAATPCGFDGLSAAFGVRFQLTYHELVVVLAAMLAAKAVQKPHE